MTNHKPATSPCRECPFRSKNGMSGWIGSYKSAEELHRLVMSETRLPCHMHVRDLEREMMFEDEANFGLCMTDIAEADVLMELCDWEEEATEEARTCTGALSYMNSCAKLSRNPRIAAEQRRVGVHRDAVKSLAELVEHHRKVKNGRKA